MRRALVLGGSVSGRGATRLLDRLGYEVAVYDEQAIDAEGMPATTVRTGPWDDGLLDETDLVVTSPGFAPASAPIVATVARGIPLWGEIELAARYVEAPIAAVTGTNGKTTVTEMIAAMLTGSGLRTVAAGNIGMPLSDVVGAASWDTIVVEVSSFQLHYSHEFHPEVAVILNIAPDHLDWHGSFEDYAAAKARIFRRQGPGDLVVFSNDDEGARRVAARAPGRRVGVSAWQAPSDGAGPDGSGFRVPTGTIALDDLAVDDPAFRIDLAAAAVAAAHCGASHPAITDIARTFTPGDHRRTVVGEWGGIRWVDDSKATNPHAALAAIAAYPSVVLIAGGRNKGLDLAPLAAADGVRWIVAIGEAADDLVAAAGPTRSTRAGSMGDAVRAADTVARRGDTVLLAPGCASFDMFTSYGERGDVFAAEVKALKEAA